MKPYGRLLAPILVVALAGCGSGATIPTAAKTTDEPTRADARPAPAPAGTLAYVLDDDVYVADPDGSNAVKIANGPGDDYCASTEGFSFWAEGSMWSPDGRYLAYHRVDCSSRGARNHEGDVVISDAAGNVFATIPADGWDIGWSPDSTRVAVWDTLFETVAVYGVDGTRHALVTMPSWLELSGDHDPAWLRDGTLAVDNVEIPPDGGAARRLDFARFNEWKDNYLATIGIRVDSPDGSQTAYVWRRSLRVESSDGSGSVTLLKAERGTILGVKGFSPEGDRILFSREEDQGADLRRELWSVGVDGSDAHLVVAGTEDGDWFVP